MSPDGAMVASGGRVLAVVGLGDSLAAARERAYAGVNQIQMAGSQHRTDIALKAERGQVTLPATAGAATDAAAAPTDAAGQTAENEEAI